MAHWREGLGTYHGLICCGVGRGGGGVGVARQAFKFYEVVLE